MNKKTKAYHSLNSQNKHLNTKLAAYKFDFEYIAEELEHSKQEVKKWNEKYLEQSNTNADLESKVESYKVLADEYSTEAAAQNDIIKAYEVLVWQMEQKKKKTFLKKLFAR